MSSSLTDIFFIIVIFQLLFISFFLFTQVKGKAICNGLLGAFFLSLCLNLLDSFLVIKKVYLYSPALVGWGIALPLLFGPLLYLYTQSVLYRHFALSRRKWLHLLPFILVFLFSESRWLFQTREVQLTLIQNLVVRKIPVVFYWSSALIFLQVFVYIGASQRLIRRYERVASNKFSDRQQVNISWLASTLIFFTACMVLAVVNGFTGLTAFSKYYYFILNIVVLLMFVFINRILLKALKRPEIFSVMGEEELDNPDARKPVHQYAGGVIAEDERSKITDQLLKYMETERPFLEPELTLDQLAVKLSIRPKILSRVINESIGQNFFDFINRYRIEEAKRLLTNPKDKKITVLEVLYEVGFNSKSSFNTLFKKHTGITPSEYKKKNMQQEQ